MPDTRPNLHPLQNPRHAPPSLRPLYIGTRFIKFNAHDTMILAAKFGVVVLATVVDGVMVHQVVGHEDLGIVDEFAPGVWDKG